MSVPELCTALLPGLDEDILDYIVSALEEFQGDVDADAEETATMISSFLMSAGFLEDEEEALVKAREVVSKVVSSGGGGGGGSTEINDDDVPQKLSEDVKKMVMDNTTDQAVPLADNNLGRGKGKVNKNTLIDEQPILSEKEVKQIKKKDEKAIKKQETKKKFGKQTAAERAEQQAMEVETELIQARIAAVQARSKLGAYKGSLDAKEFTLPNPGGGQPLLEDAACRLVWGRRYALIGRNGMGKSTMLRALAARRVGNIPENVTVHYVSQEVNLTAAQRRKTPVEIVVDADLERTLLLQEQAALDQKAAAGELGVEGSERHGQVLVRLQEIGADSAPRRAEVLLDNLGFSKELQQRPLSQLSGGWRVRTMLGAALFAKADLLLLGML